MAEHSKPPGPAEAGRDTDRDDGPSDKMVREGILSAERRVLGDTKVPEEQRRAA